jgi:aromatic ring-opening dioxygenase catalytic subunit (LigB family)
VKSLEKSLPIVFISHGTPSLLLEDILAREFLKNLGKKYSEVNAVFCISAHWMTSKPTVILLNNMKLSMISMDLPLNFNK